MANIQAPYKESYTTYSSYFNKNLLNNSYTFTEHRPENKEIINLLCSFVKQAADIFDADISDSI